MSYDEMNKIKQRFVQICDSQIENANSSDKCDYVSVFNGDIHIDDSRIDYQAFS